MAFLIGVFGLPYGLSIYFQSKGGNAVNVLETLIRLTDEPIACIEQPIDDEQKRVLLDSAISDLSHSIQLNPNLSNSYLLLGRAYCISGHYEEAIKAYQSYINLRPDNPLGHLELGFAYAAECENGTWKFRKSKPCNTSNLRQTIMDEWHTAGVELDSIYNEGNLAFSSRQYKQAARWYQLTSLFDDIPDREKFQWSVAEIMLEHDLTQIPDPQVLPVNNLDNYLEINGSTLQWMLDNLSGISIGNSIWGDPDVGYLTFSGEAIAAINVRQASTYRFTIRTQNSPPPPIRLQLEIDFRPVANFELSRGDGSWEELSTDIPLNAGLHLLGINFLNDEIINGIDRNAIIEWVKITKHNPL